jgi:16S rRNA (uracil1498-N3)-methyltransferase
MVAEMSERFYINLPLERGPVELTGAEAHHLAAVCRLRPGDAVCLFNGDGREYPAHVRTVAKKTVLLDVVGMSEPQRELPFTLEVAAPLPKGDRGSFLVEKLTELGVGSFVPLSSERSVVHPREGKMDKLQRHVIEASKQCGRNRLMRIEGLQPWKTYCRGAPAGTVCLLAQPGGTERADGLGVAVRAAVGPEGGFTDAEVAMARDSGWRLIDLGPRILRVETAALAMAMQVIALTQAGSAQGSEV